MTDQQEFFLQDCVAFLSSMAESYPTGIPEELIVAPADERVSFQTGAGNPNARLVFISAEAGGTSQSRWPLTDASANLLEAALSRGMQMSPDEVFVFNLSVGGDGETLAAFKEEFNLVDADSYIILGEEAHSLFLRSGVTSDQVGEFKQGDWYGSVLCTHELATVTRSQEVKREFWQDLKAVLRLLGGNQ